MTVRLLLATLVGAVTFAAPAGAAQCVGTQAIEGWTGVCAGGSEWLVCARDAHMHPVLYVYIPSEGSGAEPCHP